MKSSVQAERYHDISCGHRVVGHNGKCQYLHGHNYRIHFTIEANKELNELGMVLDFAVIKETLCEWLEERWDHKFLIWEDDPLLEPLKSISPESLVVVPFNPTAENMAIFLIEEVAAKVLSPYNCQLVSCKIEETRKCSATVTL